MNYCKNCGSEIDLSDKFCTQCGSAISQVDVYNTFQSNYKVKASQSNTQTDEKSKNYFISSVLAFVALFAVLFTFNVPLYSRFIAIILGLSAIGLALVDKKNEGKYSKFALIGGIVAVALGLLSILLVLWFIRLFVF